MEKENGRLIKTSIVCLLLGAAVGIVYYNVLPGGFVFDDYLLIVNHPIFPKITAAPWSVLSPTVLGYRPLRTFSYVLDYWLGGMQPWVFHLSNILYHWVTACLVFLVTLRLTRDVGGEGSAEEEVETRERRCWRTAILVALFWALHPVLTDSVSYISGRRDILGGLCFFFAFWAYLRFRAAQAKAPRRFGWLLLSCIVYGLGILSKESVITLPALCWLYDVQREGLGESIYRRWAIYVLVLLLGFAVLWYFAGAMILKTIVLQSWHGGSAESNFATVARIWVHYLSLMIYPKTLSADYSFDAFPISHSFFDPDVLTALSVLATVGVVAWALSRWRPLIGYGTLWMAIAILPVSHIIPIKEIAAEHYLYVPLYGFALICGVLLDAAYGSARDVGRARSLIVHGVIALLLVAAGIRIIERNRDWIDEETLWTVTVRTMPRCVRAHYNLAGVYLSRNRIEDARREFTVVLSLVPNHVNALAGLGEIAFQQKQYGQALGFALQAAAFEPQKFRVQYLLGWIYLGMKKFDEAQAYFQKARKLRPMYAGLYTGLESIAKERGDIKAAKRWAKMRRRLSPRTPSKQVWK